MAERPTPEELQDLIDGRLRGDRLQEVYEHLARDPELARYVQELRANDIELQRYGRQILSDFGSEHGHGAGDTAAEQADSAFPTPQPPGRGRGRLRSLTAVLATAVIAAVIGAGGGWQAHQSYRDPGQHVVNRIVGDATSAYAYIGSGLGNGFDFTPKQNEAFGKWASEAFGVAIQPPDLSKVGYSYAGARVFPTADRTASLLAYRSKDDATVSVYCWRDGNPQRTQLPAEVRRNGYEVRFMTARDVGIAVVARRETSDFESTAKAIFQAFSSLISAKSQTGGSAGASG